MRTKERYEQALAWFQANMPVAESELNFENEYQLLVAVMLSAQCTDKRVNMVTPVIFNKYKNLEEISNATAKDLEDIIRPLGSFRKKSLYLKEIANILLKKYNSIEEIKKMVNVQTRA